MQTVVETPTYLAIANKLFSEDELADIVAPIFAARYDVSGLSGATLKFRLTAGSSITAMPIYAQ